MNAARIRQALGKYLHEPSDTILLEIKRGKVRSEEGGMWVEIKVEDMEALTEDAAFNPVESGWAKYLDKFEKEGLITKDEKDKGK